jgi:hypothetical protein
MIFFFSLALIFCAATTDIGWNHDVNNSFSVVEAARAEQRFSRFPKKTRARRHLGLVKETAPMQLGECERGCEEDGDCAEELLCFKQQHGGGNTSSSTYTNDVPGCGSARGLFSEDDRSIASLLAPSNASNICYRPPTSHLVLVAQDNEPKEAFPLGFCEGNCTTDSDCNAGFNLRCFFRPAPPTISPASAATKRNIPGCTGIGDSGINYCSAVTYQPGHLTVFQHRLQLSQGLDCRIIARSGQKVQYDTDDGQSFSGRSFHKYPDGAAVFADDKNGGWVYVSNSEDSENRGGVGAIRFDDQGRVIGYRRLVSGTRRNCGGGKNALEYLLVV